MGANRVFVFVREDVVRGKTRALQQELDELQEQITKLELALEFKPDYGLGVGDPAITRWEMNLALLGQCRERAEKLERALDRANQGQYGVCRHCGEPIHPDRLKVLPGTTVCVRCAYTAEREPVR
jgi:RNA polymerase-binding transcription factor DksA